MLQLPGAAALSRFRIKKLLADLRRVSPAVSNVSARFMHYVDSAVELDDNATRVLHALLDYGDPVTDQVDGAAFYVVPRLGTISPWSSKATDIAHNCGLDQLRRIERGVVYTLVASDPIPAGKCGALAALLHDRMTETVLADPGEAGALFAVTEPARLGRVAVSARGRYALREANAALGLALSEPEIDYLAEYYAGAGHDPSDAELMMFAQANSEHCRHKIFNADWVIDGKTQPKSLFAMIRNTHAHSPDGVLSAYRDNAAVVEGSIASRFTVDEQRRYRYTDEPVHLLMKVETHNHPTAISPFAGAATGAGGEIRDEGATGRGAKPKAGLVGFSVSNLELPDFVQPWERHYGKPDRIVSALDIMIEGPIGAAAFNNEFGRPNLCGYFRTLEQSVDGPDGPLVRGYHKPIMLAGGMGNVRDGHVEKRDVPDGGLVVVLGGPAMQIGLGGGAASSMSSGQSHEELDFASVQRGNPEMQRRAQEVIDACWTMGRNNPILLIHDVGAGGLSNAVPESLDHSKRGGLIDLRAVPNDEPGMSPMAIWCNEAQERYVLIIDPECRERFAALCQRERCPYAVIGVATLAPQLRVEDPQLGDTPVDMPMSVLFGDPPRTQLRAVRRAPPSGRFDTAAVPLDEAVRRVLRMPAVAAKHFLITIGDRTVGGQVCRDQMIGPWQVPVSDVAVTCCDFRGVHGEAMAVGERTPLAIGNGPASGRMAVGEALTNIAAADIADLKHVRLSANWMAAAAHPGDDAALYDTVRAVGEELCPALGIAIPVGKDSLSLKTSWSADDGPKQVVAPVSLVVTAFAPVADVRQTLTPQLNTREPDTALLLIDLGGGRQRMGGSCLAQAWSSVDESVPDVDDPVLLRGFFQAIQHLRRRGLVLAYHDRSDGGLFATLCEMAFASRCGLRIDLDALGDDPVAALFNEELGGVIQVHTADMNAVVRVLAACGIADLVQPVAAVSGEQQVSVLHGGREIYSAGRTDLQAMWTETSYRIQSLRDNPDCANEEYDAIQADRLPMLTASLTFDPADNVARTQILRTGITRGFRPRVAILREQGVNGQLEMAAAFDRAGFASIDVHMSDILGGEVSLASFDGLVACGGFSYGDVLGAGEGWAKSILFNNRSRDEFAAFFARGDTFALGVCNGCQMLSSLTALIPGSEAWPRFRRNRSEQFEARLCNVRVGSSASLFFDGMQGSVLPIVVSHGEGRAVFAGEAQRLAADALTGLRYVTESGAPADRYPVNPNGSADSIAGLCNADGRVTILMPHPERLFRTVQHSWHPDDWGEDGPWLRMFRNARVWMD